MSDGKFYTYIHRRNDTGQVFYVGKGSRNRAHLSAGRNPYWQNIAHKHGRTVEILATWGTDEEAFLHEMLLIEIFRNLGHSLVNQTVGGEGKSGCTATAETKQKLSAASLSFWAKPATRERMIEVQKLAQARPQTKAKAAAARVARWSSPSARARASEKSKEVQSSTEYRARKSVLSKLASASVEMRAAISERGKSSWQSAGRREAGLAALNKLRLQPEVNAKRVAAIKVARATPESKAQTSAISCDRWKSEEFRDKHQLSMQKYRESDAGKAAASAFLARRSEASKKPVHCIETGITYDSSSAAVRAMGLNQSALSAVCNGRSKTTGGFTFKFSDAMGRPLQSPMQTVYLKTTKKEKP